MNNSGPLITYYFNTCYIPGIILGLGKTVVNKNRNKKKKKKNLFSYGSYVLWGDRQVNIQCSDECNEGKSSMVKE